MKDSNCKARVTEERLQNGVYMCCDVLYSMFVDIRARIRCKRKERQQETGYRDAAAEKKVQNSFELNGERPISDSLGRTRPGESMLTERNWRLRSAIAGGGCATRCARYFPLRETRELEMETGGVPRTLDVRGICIC